MVYTICKPNGYDIVKFPQSIHVFESASLNTKIVTDVACKFGLWLIKSSLEMHLPNNQQSI